MITHCFIIMIAAALFASFIVAPVQSLSTPCRVFSSNNPVQAIFHQKSFLKSRYSSILIRGGGPLNSLPLPLDWDLLSASLSSRPIISDSLLTTVILSETILWLKIWTTLAKNNVLPSTITRKIIHSGSAPLFILHWPLYSAAPSAKLLAATIPLLQIFRLSAAGLSTISDSSGQSASNDINNSKDLVQAVSRSGDKKEALQGPLIYSVVLLLATLIFFRSSPVGVIAVTQMAVGDGLADIVGRQWGSVKWPFSKSKSLIGSGAFLVGGFTISAALLLLLQVTGCQVAVDLLSSPWQPLLKLLVISILCTAVELVPGVDDNISVPVVAALLSWVLFPQ